MFQKPSPDIALNKEKPSGDQVETVVGPSVHVEGDFSSEGNILVKGSVSGKVATSRLLTVEEGAVVLADVKAGDAVISGEIRGNARIENRLELTETAKIAGDIHCKVLAVRDGALITGKVVMPGIEPSSLISFGKKTSQTKIRSKMKKDDEEENVLEEN